MSKLIKPYHYTPLLDIQQNELAIKMIKEFFQENLATGLRLHRTTGPLFVLRGMGINDDHTRYSSGSFLINTNR